MSQFLSPFGHKYIVNADFTASGAVFQPIEEYLQRNVYPYYSNTHSNAYCGKLMSHLITEAKEQIRKGTGAKLCDSIIFTGNGCSGAISHLIHSLNLRYETKPKTAVFVSVAEHHSNYLPWTHLPVDLVVIPLTKEGTINLNYLQKKLEQHSDQPKICSFIAGSNVTGVIQPVYALAKLAHRYRSLILMDFAGCAPYIPINMHYDDESYFDAIFISPHKFLGGPGTPGLLIANHKLFRNNEPYCPAGGTVRFVCKDFKHYSSDPEIREVGGTPNIIGCIKTGLVFQLKSELLTKILKREGQIRNKVEPVLRSISNLQLINPETTQNQHDLPIFSFMVKNLHYNLVVVLLNDLFGIQSRGGVSCCSVLAQYLLHLKKADQMDIYRQIVGGQGVPQSYGWCRVTFHYSMQNYEVDYILNAIKFVCQYGKILKKQYRYIKKTNNWIHRGFQNQFPKLDYHLLEPRAPKLTKTMLEDQYREALKQAVVS